MGTIPHPRDEDQRVADRALRRPQDLDDALIVRAGNDAVTDVRPADTEDAGPALSRAERRGNRRPGAKRRPGSAGRKVPIKRPVGRGRDPRLPRR